MGVSVLGGRTRVTRLDFLMSDRVQISCHHECTYTCDDPIIGGEREQAHVQTPQDILACTNLSNTTADSG